jgi:hypothetical protein
MCLLLLLLGLFLRFLFDLPHLKKRLRVHLRLCCQLRSIWQFGLL